MTRVNAGLCDDCTHSKRIVSARGSVFFMCLVHERDPRFAKYPRLPVVQCSGYRLDATQPAVVPSASTQRQK